MAGLTDLIDSSRRFADKYPDDPAVRVEIGHAPEACSNASSNTGGEV